MARRILALLALVAATIGTASAAFPGWNINDVSNLGFRIRPTRQQKGKAITLEGRIRINRFAPGDLIECGFRNMNETLAPYGLNNMKTKVQNYKKGTNYNLTTGSTVQKVFWEWNKAAAAVSSNKIWTLTAKVTVDKNTAESVYWWRWFCEMKYPSVTPAVPADYYWKDFKSVPLYVK